MKDSLAAALLLAGIASAAPSHSSGSGPGPYPNASYFAEQNKNPTSNRNILFQPYYSQNGNNVLSWTWQVNITAIPSPYNVVNTVYAFLWPPSNGTLNQIAGNVSNLDPQHFCVTAVDGFKPNATDAWDANAQGAGDCISALGNECVKALGQQWQIAKTDGNGCKILEPDMLGECRGSFEGYEGTRMNLVDNGTAVSGNQYKTFPLQSGTGFYYESSGADGLMDAEGQLRMLLIDSGEQFRALCTRVKANESSTEANGGAKDNAGSATSMVGSGWLVGAAVAVVSAFLL